MMAPLTGLRVIEFEGIGPGPLAARMLADLGADVTVIARPGTGDVAKQLGGASHEPMRRGKQVVILDLKQSTDRDEALRLIADADALIEGNRPGIMEKLGLGPIECAAINPKLIYGRMTGWGQTGPMAHVAGHDLNYVALTGILSLSAYPGERPNIPPTVVGDAAGALGLAFGIVSALLSARCTGKGCVVDGAIVDIVAMLGSIALWVRASGQLDAAEPSPLQDSPFYSVYTCSDGACITLGAIEPKFYVLLLDTLGIDDLSPTSQYDIRQWPTIKSRLSVLFASRPRAHWCALLEGTDTCFSPVLSISEAAAHPHNQARGIYLFADNGAIDAAPAPRFLPLVPVAPTIGDKTP